MHTKSAMTAASPPAACGTLSVMFMAGSPVSEYLLFQPSEQLLHITSGCASLQKISICCVPAIVIYSGASIASACE
jgi:hypothetical protein